MIFKQTISIKQIVFFILSCLLTASLIAVYVDEALIQTMVIALLVLLFGNLLIIRLSSTLEDKNIKLLMYFFLIKIPVVIFVLYSGWVPDLYQCDRIAGYDPMRYYFNSIDLSENGFGLEYLPGINYSGILFYYGFIFKLIGVNPVIPALFNILTTLIATYMLVKTGYLLKTDKTSKKWVLGMSMMLPEIIWYDCITARESLVMAIFTCVIALSIEWNQKLDKDKNLKLFFIAVLVFIVGIIRTSILIPTILSVFATFLISRKPIKKNILVILMLSAVLITVILVIPELISNYMGSSTFSYLENMSFNNRAEIALSAELDGFSDKSIGLLFLADTPLKAILYLPIRIGIYLVAPLPNILFNLDGLLNSDSASFQSLFVSASSLLNIILFPLVLASLVEIFVNRRCWRHLYFQMPFWILFITICVGNQLIHERYRIMSTLLLYGCIWLGTEAKSKIILSTYIIWFSLLIFGGSFFYLYKAA